MNDNYNPILTLDPEVTYNKSNDTVNIKGNIDVQDGSILEYYAGNPPTYMFSYGGSALPYPNAQVAYSNSSNNGKLVIKGNFYSFNITSPNAFYSGLGTKYVEPHVIIRITDISGYIYQPIFVRLDNGIPYKSLTYSPPPNTWPRSSPLFYYGKDQLPIRTQEQILKDSAFPKTNKYPNNFWGLKPMQ